MDTYYNFPVPIRPAIFAVLHLQYIGSPGRIGPVSVPGVRSQPELREGTNMSFVRSNATSNPPGGTYGA